MANNTNWLNISSQSGSSGQTILTLSANKNLSTNYKTAEITAYNPVYNISAKTYVTLEAYSPILSISPDLFGVPDSGGTYELTISANCAWVIAFPDLVTSYSTTAGTGNAVVTFTVPGTTADTTLVGNIVVTDESGQVSRTARVEQYGSGVHIGVFPAELYFDSTGGSKTFSVTADAAYNVSVGSGTDWAFVEPHSGYTGQTTFTVTVNSENTGTTDKQGVINIDAPGQDLAVILYHKKPEMRLVATYYVTSTTEPTHILYNSSGLTSAEYPDGTQIPLETGYTFPSTGYQTVYYTLADNTTIGSSVFGNPNQPNTDLVSIVVPSGVTTFGSAAFWYCSSLTSLTLPDTITRLGNSMLVNCTSLSSITIPDSVTEIAAHCFDNCTSLSSITIPSGVTTIGSSCFTGSSVSSITFTSLTPPTLGNTNALTSNTLSEIIVPCPAVNDYITAYPQYAQYISCSETGTTLYFTTDTSNVKGTGETRTITILNTNINPNRTGLNLPSDFPQQGSYVVDGNVIYLTYPRNPSSSATRNWTIGVVGQTNDGVSLSGSYQITQDANTTYSIPYTADTSTVDASGETRTITIDTSNLVASSITIGIEGATGVTYTYENGVITVVFPDNTDSSRSIAVNVTGQTLNGNSAVAAITYIQSASSSLLGQYLTFNILERGKISWYSNTSGFNRTIQYSKNGGSWTNLPGNYSRDIGYGPVTATGVTVEAGDIIQFRGDNTEYGGYGPWRCCHFGFSTAKFNIEGNIMSLISSTNFANLTTVSDEAFLRIFGGTKVVSAHNLLLPATTIGSYCYSDMFNGCSSLTTAPTILPAMALAGGCYAGMFINCTSLTTAPALPATSMVEPILDDYTYGEGCYAEMFRGCTSLTTAPALPATVLKRGCYNSMFQGCTSLTTAPALPATAFPPSKLADEAFDDSGYGCYAFMFAGCTALTTVPAFKVESLSTTSNGCFSKMFWGCTNLTGVSIDFKVTTLPDMCCSGMFKDCSSLLAAPDISASTVGWESCREMFSGCISLRSAPRRLAQTLYVSSYRDMFYGCSSLTTAPELPATTLARDCYYSMFEGCTKLNYIKCLATVISASNCTTNWVKGVAATGTFITPSSTNWTTGTSDIPSGWTRVNSDT